MNTDENAYVRISRIDYIIPANQGSSKVIYIYDLGIKGQLEILRRHTIFIQHINTVRLSKHGNKYDDILVG